MANVQAPMMSLAARGSLGRVLTFQGKKKGFRVGRQAVPTQTYTAKQGAIKLINSFITDFWSHLLADQQATYAKQAAELNLSPYHAFLKLNLARYQKLKGPPVSWPPAESTTIPPQNYITSGKMGDGSYIIVSVHTAGQPMICTFYLKESVPTNPNPNQTIAISMSGIASYDAFYFWPPGPGYYFFQTMFSMQDGNSRLNSNVHGILVP